MKQLIQDCFKFDLSNRTLQKYNKLQIHVFKFIIVVIIVVIFIIIVIINIIFIIINIIRNCY